jgi:hypothetical protein
LPKWQKEKPEQLSLRPSTLGVRSYSGFLPFYHQSISIESEIKPTFGTSEKEYFGSHYFFFFKYNIKKHICQGKISVFCNFYRVLSHGWWVITTGLDREENGCAPDIIIEN